MSSCIRDSFAWTVLAAPSHVVSSVRLCLSVFSSTLSSCRAYRATSVHSDPSRPASFVPLSVLPCTWPIPLRIPVSPETPLISLFVCFFCFLFYASCPCFNFCALCVIHFLSCFFPLAIFFSSFIHLRKMRPKKRTLLFGRLCSLTSLFTNTGPAFYGEQGRAMRCGACPLLGCDKSSTRRQESLTRWSRIRASI